MSWLDRLARASVLALAGLITSCIDGHEEYWLEADGSGRAEAEYTIPAAVATLHGGENGIQRLLEEFLESTPEIRDSSLQISTEGNRLNVKVSVAFDSALDLRKVAAGSALHRLPDSASHLAGTVFAEIRGRTLDFQRTIAVGKAIPGSALLPDSQWEGHKLSYIMHLPAAATESNATRTEDSGKTLVWEFPLEQTIRKPVQTRFKMPVPIPWKWVAWIGIPLTLASGAAFAWRRGQRVKTPA